MGARPQKTAVVSKVREDLEGTTATVLTDYRGLSVQKMADLRARLRENGATYTVAKNTLIRLAAAELGYDVPREVLSGPTALAYTGENIAVASKALRAFAKDNPSLLIKGAILDGAFLDADQAAQLADLESQEELLASFAGMFETMLAYFPRMADDLLSETEGLMTALMEKKPEGDAPAAAGEATADADAPDETPAAPADDAPADHETSDASADAPADASAENATE
jgi:large subunit ribosomal protein L10